VVDYKQFGSGSIPAASTKSRGYPDPSRPPETVEYQRFKDFSPPSQLVHGGLFWFACGHAMVTGYRQCPACNAVTFLPNQRGRTAEQGAGTCRETHLARKLAAGERSELRPALNSVGNIGYHHRRVVVTPSESPKIENFPAVSHAH